MRKRRLKQFLKVLACLAALLALLLVFERVRGQIALARYKQNLIAQGEKLSPKDFVQSFSEADNGAPAVISASERLQRGAVLPHNLPPAMRIMPSGRALVGFRQPEWVETGTYRDGEWVNEKVTNRWDQVAADLKSNEVTFAEIRAALAKPVLNNRIDLSQGMNMRLEHLAGAKRLAQWFGAASQLALHEGRTQDALNSLLVQVRFPRLLAEDHLFISELVRIAIAALAKNQTWEALQADGWRESDLAALQEAWERLEFTSAMVRGLEGERVTADVNVEMCRQSQQEPFGMLHWIDVFPFREPSAIPLWQRVIMHAHTAIWRFAWSHQDQRACLENMQQLLVIMPEAAKRKSYAAVSDDIKRCDERFEGGSFSDKCRLPLSWMLMSGIARAVDKAMRAETDRSLTLAAIALKRYALRHGKYPTALDALVPEFLAAVPIDYMDGQPLKYRLNADGSFMLYSVGQDGRDDGGDASPPTGKTTRNLWQRRDYVWPAPALPEEVEAWRNEQAKN